MGVRGRKSAASRAVVAIVGNPGPAQSTPPVYLTPEQDEVWRVVVSSRGGDLITKESFPLLVEYCRATVAANQIAAQIDEFLPEWAKDDEGLKRWDKLLAMQDRQAKLVAQLGES